MAASIGKGNTMMMIIRIRFRITRTRGVTAIIYDIVKNKVIGTRLSTGLNKKAETGKFVDDALRILKAFDYPMPDKLYIDENKGKTVVAWCLFLPEEKPERSST